MPVIDHEGRDGIAINNLGEQLAQAAMGDFGFIGIGFVGALHQHRRHAFEGKRTQGKLQPLFLSFDGSEAAF